MKKSTSIRNLNTCISAATLLLVASNPGVASPRLPSTGSAPYTLEFFPPEPVLSFGVVFIDIQVFSETFTCNTKFTSPSASSFNDSIIYSYVPVDSAGPACPADGKKYGPKWFVPADKAGNWVVVLNRLPDCFPAGCADPFISTVVGNIVVKPEATGIRNGSPSVSFQARNRDGVLSFRTPQGAAGNWKAKVYSLSGALVGNKTLETSGNSEVELNVTSLPSQGAYILRLQAPDNSTHMLRVPMQK